MTSAKRCLRNWERPHFFAPAGHVTGNALAARNHEALGPGKADAIGFDLVLYSRILPVTS